MPVRYPTYRLALPSGGVVRVRKADVAARAGQGVLVSSLFLTAFHAVSEPSEDDGTTRLDSLHALCRVCLIDADIDPAVLSLADCLAVVRWGIAAMAPPAIPDEPGVYTARDFEPLVRSPAAVLLDACCSRYHVRPSTLLGLGEDVELAADLDMAVAYRGIRREHDGTEGEVDVQDVLGDTHHVPSHWLPSVPQGARATHMDTYAKLYGPRAWSVGGGTGLVHPNAGYFGPMPGSDGLRHW